MVRTTGSCESLESRAASRKSPFSTAAKTFSRVSGSRRRLSRDHQKMRSPTTATATIAVMRIGHMTGPPASKYFTRMFANILVVVSYSYRCSVSFEQFQMADSLQDKLARPEVPPRLAGRETPAVFYHAESRLVEHSITRSFLDLGGRYVARLIDLYFNSHGSLVTAAQRNRRIVGRRVTFLHGPHSDRIW